MRKRTRPVRQFEGIVISSGKSKNPRPIRAALRRTGLTGWKIKSLGPGAPFFLAMPPAKVNIATGAAWHLTYQLRNDREVSHAEPAFETAGLDAAFEGARSRSTRSGVGTATDLPGSAPHDWAIQACNIREAWRNSPNPQGAGVLVGHPDTGYAAHDQLDPSALLIQKGYNFFEDSTDPRDPLSGNFPGHGTSTGSVLISADDKDVIGVAPQAKLIPLRVNDSVIYFSWRRLCSALYWAVDKKFHILSMSLGGLFGGSGALEQAIQHASKNGILLFAAAGNHVSSVVYPARMPDVIAVAASNANSHPWSGSSNGPEVDITAPGESIWRAHATAQSKSIVDRSSGTSYATAHVAGICALWIAHHGGWAALSKRFGAENLGNLFKETLQRTSTKPAGWDTKNYGPGIVEASKLLSIKLPAKAPVRAMRAASRFQSLGPWERIEALFPDSSSDMVRSVVLSHFRSGETRSTYFIAPVLDELHFHIATDPELRSSIATRLKSKPKKSTTRSASTRLSSVSPELRRKLAY